VTRRHRLVRAVAAAVVGTAFLLLAVGPAGAQTDPVEEAQQAVAAARAEADQAADAYFEQLSRFKTLEGEIGATMTRLEELEARAAELREIVQDRAALAYLRSGSTDLEFGLDSDEEALEVARRSALLDRLNRSDNDAAEELAGLTDSLRAKRARLESDRADQKAALAGLKEQQEALDAKLAAAQASHNAAVAAEQAAAREAAEQAAAEQAAEEAPAPTPSSAPAPAPAPAETPKAPTPPASYTPTPGEHPRHMDPFLVCTRQIESGGNYQAYNASGPYYGAYQFLQSTWNSAANHAGRYELIGLDPRRASEYDQDDMAWTLYQWQGKGPWNGRC